MSTNKNWAVALLMIPFGLGASACGSDADERSALNDDELDREIELALRADDQPVTFDDSPVSETEEPAASAPPAPAPQRQQPQARQPTQPPPAPAQPPARRTETVAIAAGTSFAVTLNQTLSTETSQPGEAFTATLSDPLRAADGSILIPAGATVRGRVTAVEKSGRIGETALIKLAFETISWGGNSHPLRASVIEANPERRTRTGAGESAAKIGAGAAAGAVLGQVLGRDTRSTVKGAVIGAAAGTAIAMGTADVDAVLSSGSRMVLRLDSPIQIERVV